MENVYEEQIRSSLSSLHGFGRELEALVLSKQDLNGSNLIEVETMAIVRCNEIALSVRKLENTLSDFIKQYGIEVRTTRNKEKRNVMSNRLTEFESQKGEVLDIIRKLLEEHDRMVLFSRDNNREANLHKAPNPESESQGLLSDEDNADIEMMEKGSRSLQKSKQQMEDILNAGDEIANNLRKNRETIEGAHRKVNNTNDLSSQATGLINRMISRESRKGMILKFAYMITGFVLVYLIVVNLTPIGSLIQSHG